MIEESNAITAVLLLTFENKDFTIKINLFVHSMCTFVDMTIVMNLI